MPQEFEDIDYGEETYSEGEEGQITIWGSPTDKIPTTRHGNVNYRTWLGLEIARTHRMRETKIKTKGRRIALFRA